MTGPEYINAVQAYYGMQYTPGQRPVIGAYVLGKTPEFLDVLFDEVTASFSAQYKTLPDKAIFVSLESKVIETLKDREATIATKRIKAPDEQYATEAELNEFWQYVKSLAKAKRVV